MTATRPSKGSTLTELVIVLAIVAIVSVMVVSFCMFANSYVMINDARSEAIVDLSNVRANVTDWLSYFNYKDCQLTLSEEGDLYATYLGQDYTIRLEDAAVQDGETARLLKGSYPSPENGEELSLGCSVKNIDSITFEEIRTIYLGKAQCYYLCTVKYTIPALLNEDGETETFTFLLTYRGGETS